MSPVWGARPSLRGQEDEGFLDTAMSLITKGRSLPRTQSVRVEKPWTGELLIFPRPSVLLASDQEPFWVKRAL